MHTQVDDEVNRAARTIAERAVEKVPTFKVPLAESVSRGSLKMTTKRAPVFHNAPTMIYELLKNHPDGLLANDITNFLKGKVPPHWTRQHTSNRLNYMGKMGWAKLWPGFIWKVGPTPINYVGMGGYKRKKRAQNAAAAVGKPPRLEKLKVIATKQEKSVQWHVQSAIDAVNNAQAALTIAGDALKKVVAEGLKIDQREKAIAAARKLLEQAGV